VPQSSWSGTNLAQGLADRCRTAGLDLAAFLQVGWYNEAVEPHSRLPDFGDPQSLAVLIGNTGAFWPHLLDTLRAGSVLLDDPHPVEAYTMHRVREAADCLQVPY
jgi:hypothetical protein